jgi:hypothetical protein
VSAPAEHLALCFISRQVDPIVASFTGGAVGVLSMLLLVEVNNAKARARLDAHTGWGACGTTTFRRLHTPV